MKTKHKIGLWAAAILLAAFDIGAGLVLKSFVDDLLMTWEENAMDFVIIAVLVIIALAVVKVNLALISRAKEFIKKPGSG